MAEGLPRSVWAKNKSEHEARSPPISSFVEIMSETLAEELQEKDLLEFDQEQEALEASLRDLDTEPPIENDCSHDFALAMALSEDPDHNMDMSYALELQRQFDREMELQNQLESKDTVVTKRGTTIALAPDRFMHSKLENELLNKEEEANDDELEAAIEEKYQTKVQDFPSCGYRRNENGEIITKHNKEIGQQRNCQNMMHFPTNFNSGDILGNKISSRIYNDLQMFSKGESKRHARLKDKDTIATSDASIDVKTRLIILKWINNGDLDSVEGAIAIGKESTVLNGVCKATEAGTSEQEDQSEERHFAIKVHKQTLNAFRNRSDYVKEDIRFKNPRSVLKIWTEKEYLNMMRLWRAGLPCPKPIQFKKHVLLMSLIQDESGKPAPKLKNYVWTSEEEKKEMFGQVKEIMVKMYKNCHLVHSDMSEYNLLFTGGKIFVIDMAQAVTLEHPKALPFLQRDIENVLRFFDRNATEDLPSAHELFTEITDIQVESETDLLTQIESFNELNLSTNLAKFRKTPGDFELMMADRERDAQLDYESSDSEDE